MAGRRRVRRVARFVAALFALYLAAGYVTARLAWLPTVRAGSEPTPAADPPDTGIRAAGALAVHTHRSHDAIGTEDEVTRAARAAGLDFVILTDHRSGSAPDSLWDVQARYDDGILLMRGQEVSLGGEVGRVLTIGLDTVLTRWESGPRELARALVADSATAIVAHSRSPRVRDSWRPSEVPGIVGWEVFDLADIGRERLAGPWVVYHSLALAASSLVGRGHASLLSLFREGFRGPAVAAYDSLYRRGDLTALAGLDAHPKLRVLGRPVPGYEPFFRSLVNHVVLETPLPDEPLEATRRLSEAIEDGRVYISFGDAGAAAGFRLRLSGAGRDGPGIGGQVEWAPGLTLEAGFAGSAGGRYVYRVIKDGEPVASLRGRELRWPLPGPGAYRVEVHRYTLRVGPLFWNLRPWLFVRSAIPNLCKRFAET